MIVCWVSWCSSSGLGLNAFLQMVSQTIQGETPSLNTQSCNRRPLRSTFKFENLRSPKKPQFYSKKTPYNMQRRRNYPKIGGDRKIKFLYFY